MRKQEFKMQVFVNLVFIISCVMVLFPFLLVLSVSFSSEKDIASFGYSVIPRNIDLSAYKYIFKNLKSILDAYKVTIAFSVIYTFLSVLFMAMLAYALTKKTLKGKNALSFYLYFTMLFSGGLVPTYILITQYLHLGDTIWVYIIPGLISPWYVFMMRTFFQGIPQEISESALIDGASEYVIFFKMILPLSKPVLATIALFSFLGKWNDWMNSMLYINRSSLISLQYLLQRMMENIKLLQDSNLNSAMVMATTDLPSETARMAMAVIVAGPALLVFPFFQKYFVKGLTVGSVKG